MNREKQIEEMADVLERAKVNACATIGSMNSRFGMWYATALYTEGYRKQSEGEWIRAENPPEEYRDECGELIPFLVCCQGTVYPFRAMYDGANWGDGIGVLKVTHWMPLPEPPDMKGGE